MSGVLILLMAFIALRSDGPEADLVNGGPELVGLQP